MSDIPRGMVRISQKSDDRERPGPRLGGPRQVMAEPTDTAGRNALTGHAQACERIQAPPHASGAHPVAHRTGRAGPREAPDADIRRLSNTQASVGPCRPPEPPRWARTRRTPLRCRTGDGHGTPEDDHPVRKTSPAPAATPLGSSGGSIAVPSSTFAPSRHQPEPSQGPLVVRREAEPHLPDRSVWLFGGRALSSPSGVPG